jgi:anti-anti-sigma factor
MSASPFGSDNHNGAIRVVQETDEIVAICLEGDFDLANAPRLRDEIDRLLEGRNDLIVDLSKATFVDSSVINVLLQASKAARGRNRMVLQLGTATIVERALELANMWLVLQRADDRQEAVRIVRQQTETL